MVEEMFKVNEVPELKAQLEATARELSGLSEDSLIIAGADNKMLVKARTTFGQTMIDQNRVLFPVEIDQENYLVCVAQLRQG